MQSGRNNRPQNSSSDTRRTGTKYRSVADQYRGGLSSAKVAAEATRALRRWAARGQDLPAKTFKRRCMVLAMEVEIAWWSAEAVCRNQQVDPQNAPSQSALGCTAKRLIYPAF